FRRTLQTAATLSSSSANRTCFANRSKAAVRLIIAPPANGSINRDGRTRLLCSHSRTYGTSHVLPPGYLNGLRCGTLATLTGLPTLYLTLRCEVNSKIKTPGSSRIRYFT